MDVHAGVGEQPVAGDVVLVAVAVDDGVDGHRRTAPLDDRHRRVDDHRLGAAPHEQRVARRIGAVGVADEHADRVGQPPLVVTPVDRHPSTVPPVRPDTPILTLLAPAAAGARLRRTEDVGAGTRNWIPGGGDRGLRCRSMRRRAHPTLLVTFGLVLALLAMGYGALFSMLDDIRDEYGIGESALGAVIGIGFFAGFLSQILIAPLADRGHARQLVLGGMLLGIAGLLLMAMARDFVPLLVGRFVMGIGVGMAVPAIRRIVIVAEPERIGHNLGRLLAVDVAGFAAGPAVVGTARRAVRHPGAVPRDRRRHGASPCRSSPATRGSTRRAEPPPAAAGVRPPADPAVRRRGRPRLRGVADDRRVRRPVGGRARRPRHERLDRQPRHHPVRPAARDLRLDRRAPRPARRTVPRRHGRPAARGDVHDALRTGAVGRGDVRRGDGPLGQRRADVSSTGVAVGLVVAPASGRPAPRACSAASRRSSPASPRW